MENSKANLNVVQRFYDAYNKKQDAILNEVIADDYVDYGHQPPGRGIQGAKSDHQDFGRAFEDARFDIDEMFGSTIGSWFAGRCMRLIPGRLRAFTDTKEGSGSRNQPLSTPRWKDHGNP